MYQKPTVPRSIGGLLDDSLQLYKASLGSCLLPALLASLIMGALSYFIIAAMPMTTAPVAPAELMARYSGLIGTFGLWYLLVIALTLVLYATLIAIIVAVSRGGTLALGAALGVGVRRAPALFVASLAFGISIAVGFILLIIPGFYLWNRMQLYMVPLVAEPQGPFTSIGTSWRLVGGNWWRTATVVFVIFVIVVVLEMVIGALAGTVAVLAGAGSAITTNPALLAGRVSLITMLIGGVVRIFTTPLVLAAFVAIYQDLCLRKGGSDLEARLGALPKT